MIKQFNPCEKCKFRLVERDSLFEKCTLGKECDAFRCRECDRILSPSQYYAKDGLCLICYRQEYDDNFDNDMGDEDE